MGQILSLGQSSTSEVETWRCSGTLCFLSEAHTSHKFSSMQSQIALFNTSVAFHVAESSSTQQSTVDHTHQPDIRPESANSVNPIILSNTAKLFIDSGYFDHCCPLEFATQCELKEGRLFNASAAHTIKLKHYGTRVVGGWTRDVNGTEIPLKIRFNVFDVRSPLLSTSKLRKHGYSVLVNQQQTIQKKRHNDRVDRPGEVNEKMCAPFEEIDEEARRATPMYVPRRSSDTERRAHEIHHMPHRSWCEYCVRGRGKESPQLSRY